MSVVSGPNLSRWIVDSGAPTGDTPLFCHPEPVEGSLIFASVARREPLAARQSKRSFDGLRMTKWEQDQSLSPVSRFEILRVFADRSDFLAVGTKEPKPIVGATPDEVAVLLDEEMILVFTGGNDLEIVAGK